MKNKWDHEAVNSQEDEDGFNLNPGSVFNYESAKGNEDINSNNNTANTEPGSAKLAVVSTGRDKEFSNVFFPLQQSRQPYSCRNHG